MNFSPANVLAGSFAVLLHVAVAGLFFVQWEDEQPVASDPDKKYYIPAKMYSENPHTARDQKQAAEKSRQQAVARERRLAAEAEEKQKNIDRQKALDAEKAKQQALIKQQERDRLDQLKAEQAARDAEAQRNREAEEEMLARTDDELQKLVNAEIDAIKAVTDDEKALAYVGQIQADIVQNWSRPASARNGMQTLLKVFLVPTGEVVDVSVIESSGNDAFDRSAVQAVRKVRRFDVPKDPRLFESKFREFEVLFRPEDLRL